MTCRSTESVGSRSREFGTGGAADHRDRVHQVIGQTSDIEFPARGLLGPLVVGDRVQHLLQNRQRCFGAVQFVGLACAHATSRLRLSLRR